MMTTRRARASLELRIAREQLLVGAHAQAMSLLRGPLAVFRRDRWPALLADTLCACRACAVALGLPRELAKVSVQLLSPRLPLPQNARAAVLRELIRAAAAPSSLGANFGSAESGGASGGVSGGDSNSNKLRDREREREREEQRRRQFGRSRAASAADALESGVSVVAGFKAEAAGLLRVRLSPSLPLLNVCVFLSPGSGVATGQFPLIVFFFFFLLVVPGVASR